MRHIDLTYLVLDEVSILENLLPVLDALAHRRHALSPDVDCNLKLHYLILVSVGLGLLEHVATTLIALHDQLVQKQVVEVHVIHILGELSVPPR